MQEARRPRLSRGARLGLLAAGLGIAWAGASLILGGAAQAHADDGLLPDVAGSAIDTVTAVVDAVPVAPVVEQVVDHVVAPVLDTGIGPLPPVSELPIVGDVVDIVPPVVLPPVEVPPLLDAPATSRTAPVAGIAADAVAAAPRTLHLAPRAGAHKASVDAGDTLVTTPSPAAAPQDAPASAPLPTPAPAPAQSAASGPGAAASAPADRTSSPRARFGLTAAVVPLDDAPLPGPARVVDSSPD